MSELDARGADEQGPRIYNLFPLLCGSAEEWAKHLPRIASMGFNWVYLNPFHYPGFSGSLYAVRDEERLHPLFQGGSSLPPDALVRGFVDAAHRFGLRVMMDLVINHTAKDSVLVDRHPGWYAREADGSLRSPRAIDPADARNVTIWGDLAEIDYGSDEARPAIIRHWQRLVERYAALGLSGFRCDAAYKVPAPVWDALIGDARSRHPRIVFAAETLGCRAEEVDALAAAGFDYIFNSVKWWDGRAPWALEQYDRFRALAPSIGFPESHDTERLAAELTAAGIDDVATTAAAYRQRYAIAAFFSTGVLMPVGYEFGFRRKPDVVATRPADWETPQFDIVTDIAAINRAKAACPALNEEGPQQRVDVDDRLLVLLRHSRDRQHRTLFVANRSPAETVPVEVARIAQAAGTDAEGLCVIGASQGHVEQRSALGGLAWALFGQRRDNPQRGRDDR